MKLLRMGMPEPRYVVEPLGKHHQKSGFSCGQEALETYLLRQASQDVKRRLAQVFVMRPLNNHRVAEFYTLSAAVIQARFMPTVLAKKLPQYPLPAVLLGRLAVDTQFQGQGLGKLLLVDALKRALAASHSIAIHAMVVDAKDAQAKSFYEKFGFIAFSDLPLRLFLPLKSVQQFAEP